jgi:hypothetical protein
VESECALDACALHCATSNEEASFVAADDAVRAHLVVDGALEAVARSWRSNRGSAALGVDPGTRELVSKTRYLVPYRVRDDTAVVLRAVSHRRLSERW